MPLHVLRAPLEIRSTHSLRGVIVRGYRGDSNNAPQCPCRCKRFDNFNRVAPIFCDRNNASQRRASEVRYCKTSDDNGDHLIFFAYRVNHALRAIKQLQASNAGTDSRAIDTRPRRQTSRAPNADRGVLELMDRQTARRAARTQRAQAVPSARRDLVRHDERTRGKFLILVPSAA